MDEDRIGFLRLLGEVCEIYNWECYAYCLMDNHYHLLIETPEANLSRGMRQLNGVYTLQFNHRHNRVGHVFQGRYKAIHVDKDSYLLELSRYIVLNPVRARMVRGVGQWPWSSYAITISQESPKPWLNTEWLLAAFAKRKKTAIERYKQFVAEGRDQPSPWLQVKNQVYLGDNDFVETMRGLVDGDRDLTEIPGAQRRPPPLSIEAYETLSATRDEAIMAAYQSGGYTQKEIGGYFGLHYARVSRIIKKVRSQES